MEMTKNKRTLSAFLLAMMNVAAVCSIRNWPITAEYGLTSITYFALSAVFFFVPVAFVAAELATGWPEQGGVFSWVKAAFGHRLGFLSVWLLWIENVVWYPTILSFIAATIAYLIKPMLADNATYTFLTILVIFWTSTLVNLKGMKMSSYISSVGVIIGTIIPGFAIILLGTIWICGGQVSHTPLSWSALLPDFSSPRQMSLLAGVLLGLMGLELSAVHAKDVSNPRRDYPKAILYSTCLIILLSTLGSLAIAVVIPKGEISLLSGSIAALSSFLDNYNLSWLTPVLAVFVILGALGGVNTWIAGPPRGLLAAANSGDLPPLLHKTNAKGVPSAMLIGQAAVVSIVAFAFLYMPNVNASYWILVALASQLYLIMYILMFAAAIVLRYKQPDVVRTYKIPGGNFGMWLVALCGIFGSLYTIVLGFFPPDQLKTGSVLAYEILLGGAIFVCCATPFIILLFKKRSWKLPR